MNTKKIITVIGIIYMTVLLINSLLTTSIIAAKLSASLAIIGGAIVFRILKSERHKL
jgi:hypothetical protein